MMKGTIVARPSLQPRRIFTSNFELSLNKMQRSGQDKPCEATWRSNMWAAWKCSTSAVLFKCILAWLRAWDIYEESPRRVQVSVGKLQRDWVSWVNSSFGLRKVIGVIFCYQLLN